MRNVLSLISDFFAHCILISWLLMLCQWLPVRLPDGLTRRGDINVLLLGDPGTAKSQLLKFVENCSPIGVSAHYFHYCRCV